MTWIVFFAKSGKRVGFLKNRIGVIQRGKLELNELEQTVSFAGRELYFTNREFRILHLFFNIPVRSSVKGKFIGMLPGKERKMIYIQWKLVSREFGKNCGNAPQKK